MSSGNDHQAAPGNERQDDAGDTPPGVYDVVHERVTEHLIGRTCARCGAWREYSGTGRPPIYCSKNCRNRASEIRTLLSRVDRELAAGLLTTEPAREVVERVTERVIERRIPVNVPATATQPTTAREWAAQLDQLADDLTRPGPLQKRHWDHRHIYRALTQALAALNQAHPGGLDNLR